MPELTLDGNGALNPTPSWNVSRLLRALGFAVAVIGFLLIIAGGGGTTTFVGFAALAVAGAGVILNGRLGPQRALRGVRVRDLLVPVCLELPHYTRVDELMKRQHGDDHSCVCLVTRDRLPIGLVTAEDLQRADPALRGQASLEWLMHPVDWVVAVDIADDAAHALTWLNLYMREFMPVFHGPRVLGIVRRDDIVREARARA